MVVEIEFSVWGSGGSKIEHRFKGVTIRYDDNAWPMVLSQEPSSELSHVVPANRFRPGQEVPYSIEFIFDGYPEIGRNFAVSGSSNAVIANVNSGLYCSQLVPSILPQ